MADALADAPPAREPPPPLTVAYHPITGIPAEYNEYLPANCEEFKRCEARSDRRSAGLPLAPAQRPPFSHSPRSLFSLPNKNKHRWKAASGAAGPATTSSGGDGGGGDGGDAAGVTAGMAGLAVDEGGGEGGSAAAPAPAAAGDAAAAVAAAPPPKKPGKKKKGDPEVVLEVTARGRKKSVTIISGEFVREVERERE